jgi:hypothetical protein
MEINGNAGHEIIELLRRIVWHTQQIEYAVDNADASDLPRILRTHSAEIGVKNQKIWDICNNKTEKNQEN